MSGSRTRNEGGKTGITSAARKKRKRRCRSASGEENANAGGGWARGGSKLCAQDEVRKLSGADREGCNARTRLSTCMHTLCFFSFFSSKASPVSVHYVRMTDSTSTCNGSTSSSFIPHVVPRSTTESCHRGNYSSSYAGPKCSRNATSIAVRHVSLLRMIRFAMYIIARCRNHAVARAFE